ncbi:MAG: hypothetical protein U1C56_02540 [Candidatus Curtissbacteria bacterium]|nr:hypothetical protein [Candidatus Curtissbacteria bacterium]
MSKKNEIPKLTEEEIAAGITIEQPKVVEIEAVDISEKALEEIARGYILGTTAIGRRKEVRELLEQKVVGKIGKKGKYITDKLFELIDGVNIIQTINGQKISYYKVPPSLPAIIYALDRVLGKPETAKPEDKAREGIKVVESIIRNLATGQEQKTRSVEVIKEV